MKPSVKNIDLEQKIFDVRRDGFVELCLEVFNFQFRNNPLYQKYCKALNADPEKIDDLEGIPYLPISFFKTHTVTTTGFLPETFFESSGTTNSTNSKHFVKDLNLYQKSYMTTFRQFYGAPQNWCILGLLPSFLQRENSSLVAMVRELIYQSNHKLSGFYLDDFQKLYATILHNEIQKQPTLLIGVTYALLDFAQQFPMQLKNTVVMETGGMKGKRRELTRYEVHTELRQQFKLNRVHSEYGMTELLSQAYSKENGVFYCPPWMKIVIREEDDPMAVISETTQPQTGFINVIDLANLYSCSFIATDDVGKLHCDNGFEVLGRKDNSELRGCSLMTID